jgi:hypothetical protein
MAEQISPVKYVEWGYEASRGFLEDGTPMNMSIVKIAQDNELLPVQIQRVCEVANHRTYAQLFKAAEDKTFTFDVADSEQIIGSLDATSEKIASDYYRAPRKGGGVDVNKIFGVTELSNEPEVDEKVKVAKQVMEKLGAARKELRAMAYGLIRRVDGGENEFYKMAKQMHLNGTPLEEVWGVARTLPNQEHVVDLFIKTAERMAEEGIFGAKLQYLMKKKGEAVDKSLISDKLQSLNKPVGVTVVNGSHPIVTTINTLAGDKANLDRTVKAVKTLDEKFDYVKKRIEDLNTSKKTDQFVQRTT